MNYDYLTAIKHGIYAPFGEHWQSRVPETGQILKQINHPTLLKALIEDMKMGYMPYREKDKMYTLSFEELLSKMWKKHAQVR